MAHTPWVGDWRKRVYGYSRLKGFFSVRELAESQPAASFETLARGLGEDVAAVQVETLLREEALSAGTMAHFLRDSLARNIREYLPDGWGIGQEAGFRASRAFAMWVSMLGEDYEDEARKAWERLRGRPPMMGWCPASADDPVLVEAFEG